MKTADRIKDGFFLAIGAMMAVVAVGFTLAVLWAMVIAGS